MHPLKLRSHLRETRERSWYSKGKIFNKKKERERGGSHSKQLDFFWLAPFLETAVPHLLSLYTINNNKRHIDVNFFTIGFWAVPETSFF